jgi:hypothetical protein
MYALDEEGFVWEWKMPEGQWILIPAPISDNPVHY